MKVSPGLTVLHPVLIDDDAVDAMSRVRLLAQRRDVIVREDCSILAKKY
jgi:hypothetical protein